MILSMQENGIGIEEIAKIAKMEIKEVSTILNTKE